MQLQACHRRRNDCQDDLCAVPIRLRAGCARGGWQSGEGGRQSAAPAQPGCVLSERTDLAGSISTARSGSSIHASNLGGGAQEIGRKSPGTKRSGWWQISWPRCARWKSLTPWRWMHGELRGQMRQVVNRFMHAYGSPNVISRESLGEGTARMAMWLSQGMNALPVYDINNSNYVLALGGNLLESSRNVIGYLGAMAFMRRGRPQRRQAGGGSPAPFADRCQSR